MYNSEEYVSATVTSMLNQTLADFEFIIVDDASTDNSADTVRSLSDSRIRLIRNAANLGVAGSLNVGLAQSRGEYIARMDADDFSVPDRLARQVAFLNANKSVGLCGTWIRCLDRGSRHVLAFPTGADCVKSYLLLGNPLAHPSVCMRTSVLRDNGLKYDATLRAAQDYEFWTRCAKYTQLDNIPEPLLVHRVHKESVSKSQQLLSDEHATAVVARQLGNLLGRPTPEQVFFHRRIGHGAGMRTREELVKTEEWLSTLLELNGRLGVWPRRGLEEAVSFVWFRVCQNSIGLGLWACVKYAQSGL